MRIFTYINLISNLIANSNKDLRERGPLKPLHNIALPTIDRCYRITSVCYSPDGYDILTSYSSESIYLFNVNVCIAMKYISAILYILVQFQNSLY